MKRLLLLPLLGCLGCETDEVRAWIARRQALELRQEQLNRPGGEVEERKAKLSGFRAALDLPAVVRDRGLAARVFIEPGRLRISVSEPVETCRDVLKGLVDSRWLLTEWKLRLEGGRCEWEGRSGADFAALEQALVTTSPAWTPPPPQLLSRGVAELKKTVAVLEADVRAREAQLGDLANLDTLERRLASVQPLVDSLHAHPAPCDLAILERELALDPPEQGHLLEIERTRLTHPLEPRGDFRLRGLVEVLDGTLVWHCEEQ